jgi:hypothetical protein
VLIVRISHYFKNLNRCLKTGFGPQKPRSEGVVYGENTNHLQDVQGGDYYSEQTAGDLSRDDMGL